MPLREMFYPLGFPLQIETNCEEILRSAAISWQGFTKLFDTPPIRIRIAVKRGRSSECPPTPVCRVQQHLTSNIADAENFSVIDLAQRFAYIWLTEAAVADRGYLRYFFIESTAMAILATSYTTAIHAACVERKGCGILLCGDSGAGKSSLSYACARAGWTYITDDASFLVNNRNDRLVVGNCNQARFRPTAVELFSELTGKEIIQRAQVGKPSIELNLQPMSSISVSFTSRINHVVFINRHNVTRQELIDFPADVARYSMRQVLFSTPATLSQQSAMIDHLLEAGPLELRYRDFDWAIDRLTQLSERGW
ncbi:MAG: aldolase [Terracidiphilus sp.]